MRRDSRMPRCVSLLRARADGRLRVPQAETPQRVVQFRPGGLGLVVLADGGTLHGLPPLGELFEVLSGPAAQGVEQRRVGFLLGQLVLEVVQGQVRLLLGKFAIEGVGGRRLGVGRRRLRAPWFAWPPPAGFWSPDFSEACWPGGAFCCTPCALDWAGLGC